MFIDTHTHIYDEQFDDDIDLVVERALNAGVEKMLMPNCDSYTWQKMMNMSKCYPNNCFPMMGLHPCYVKEDYLKDLELVEQELKKGIYCGVGEVGLDYYWDTTYVNEQKAAFAQQIDWAAQLDLPVIIHTRESLTDGIDMIRQKQNGKLRGIFHCFGGSLDEAKQIIHLGFHLGIGGVLTFKKSQLPEVLAGIDLQHIVLETDAPYLAPTPYRGKRNESAYIPIIAQKLAEIKNISIEEIEQTTTQNAKSIFHID